LRRKQYKQHLLTQEGLFWRAYEVSAYLFVRNIKDYQIKKKHYTNVGKDVVFLGFPNSVLDDILSKHNVAIEKNDKKIVLKSFQCDMSKYNEWKKNIDLTLFCIIVIKHHSINA